MSFVTVDDCFFVLFFSRKAIFALSRNIYEFVGENLHNLSSIIWTIGFHFPFIKILFRMSLDSEYRVVLSFSSRNELFVVGGFGCGGYFPERL